MCITFFVRKMWQLGTRFLSSRWVNCDKNCKAHGCATRKNGPKCERPQKNIENILVSVVLVVLGCCVNNVFATEYIHLGALPTKWQSSLLTTNKISLCLQYWKSDYCGTYAKGFLHLGFQLIWEVQMTHFEQWEKWRGLDLLQETHSHCHRSKCIGLYDNLSHQRFARRACHQAHSSVWKIDSSALPFRANRKTPIQFFD